MFVAKNGCEACERGGGDGGGSWDGSHSGSDGSADPAAGACHNDSHHVEYLTAVGFRTARRYTAHYGRYTAQRHIFVSG